MSRVKRKWGVGEELPGLIVVPTRSGDFGYVFHCPQCDAWHEGKMSVGSLEVTCPCGCHLRVTVSVTLEELEVEEVKGE